MATVMTAEKFIEMAKKAANECKSLYVMGCFGAPMNAQNKQRYENNNDYNRNPKRKAMIEAATADTFGFDCVCLIKGILWGWNGDKNKRYGGAEYASNGVPDVSADGMIKKCSEVSADFKNIKPGEMVWLPNHAGVYIGDGLAVECTPAWKNKVQITAVGNIGKKSGFKTRTWKKHGKLPWVDYKEEPKPEPTPTPEPTPEPTPSKPEDVKMELIKFGSKGKAVKIWQVIVDVNDDGIFGAQTKEATIKFQKKAFPNQPKEWDGIVGDKTWTKGLESV